MEASTFSTCKLHPCIIRASYLIGYITAQLTYGTAIALKISKLPTTTTYDLDSWHIWHYISGPKYRPYYKIANLQTTIRTKFSKSPPWKLAGKVQHLSPKLFNWQKYSNKTTKNIIHDTNTWLLYRRLKSQAVPLHKVDSSVCVHPAMSLYIWLTELNTAR